MPEEPNWFWNSALDDQREPEGQQQAVEMVEPGDALEQRALDDGAERADDERREDQRAPIIDAGQLQQEIGDEGADHVERAVGEIDDVEHAEDDGEAEAQQRVERAVDQPDHQLAVEHLRT